MSSVYNLLRESCGLSQAEAADFIHEVRLDTVKSWSSDRRPAPQFAVNQLQSLLRTIRGAGEQFAEDLKMRSQGNVFIIGHAHDDDDARVCGFPSLSSQMHSIAIAISLLPDDAEIRLTPRVRGSIAAPIMEKEKMVATQTDCQVLQGMTFKNGRCLTLGNINRRKFERLEEIGWIKGISVNISDVEYYLTPAGRNELATLPAAQMYSKHFTKFGIPDTECEIEVRCDNVNLPRLFFRSPGNPLCGLDLGGASQLKQLLEHDGDQDKAQLVGRLIEQARKLA
jgi:hypothetical protein